jgi:hypothetical protein
MCDGDSNGVLNAKAGAECARKRQKRLRKSGLFAPHWQGKDVIGASHDCSGNSSTSSTTSSKSNSATLPAAAGLPHSQQVYQAAEQFVCMDGPAQSVAP